MGGHGKSWMFAVSLVVGGCGDSGGPGSLTTSSTTTNTTAVGTTAEDPTTSGSTAAVTTSAGTTTTGESATAASDTFEMMTDPGTGVIMTSGSGDTEETTGPPPPVCGDGNVDPGEECDEGPANVDTGTCTLACKLPVCGDGLVQADVEACDDGNVRHIV